MPRPRGSSAPTTPEALRVGGVNKTRENRKAEKRGKPMKRVPGIPPAPPYLSASEKEAWDRFAEVLGPEGRKVASRQEFAAYEALVLAYSAVIDLHAVRRGLDDPMCEEPKVNKQGEVVGYVVKVHPVYAAINAADARLQSWLGRYGLTPGDAGRVGEAGTEGAGTTADEAGGLGEFRN
jgi:phage terminase small subunit